MKLISFLPSILLFLIAGCATCSDQLVMERTVPVADYSKTVDEMAKQIEMLNRYEARDVRTTVYCNKITIRVVAEKMSESRCYQKSVVRLQRENALLKNRISELEKAIDSNKLVPVQISTNGNVTVDLRNAKPKVISVH